MAPIWQELAPVTILLNQVRGGWQEVKEWEVHMLQRGMFPGQLQGCADVTLSPS
jgi:hypothetical protein